VHKHQSGFEEKCWKETVSPGWRWDRRSKQIGETRGMEQEGGKDLIWIQEGAFNSKPEGIIRVRRPWGQRVWKRLSFCFGCRGGQASNFIPPSNPPLGHDGFRRR